MNALERARHFVQNDAVRTALVIVPLAMSGAAQAAPVFDHTSAFAVFQVTAGSAVQTDDRKSLFAPLANGGVRWTGQSNSYLFDGSASGGDCLKVADDLPFRCGISVTVSGDGSGALGADIPAHWDFSLEETGNVTNELYQVQFFVNGTQVGSGTALAGNIDLTGWNDGDPLATWRVELSASFDVTGSGTVRMVIPPNSIDIMPRAATPVPEPASLLLAATGIGWIAARRRRRRS